MFKVNASDEIEAGGNLSITGYIEASMDAGKITLFDMPLSIATALGTTTSASLRIGEVTLLKLYGEGNGSGGITNTRVAIGTSTPYAKLTIQSNSTASDAKTLEIINSASTSLMVVMNNGYVGVGTSTPAMKFSVQGDALADSWNVYSDIYVGDALTALKQIQGEEGALGDWAPVVHSTLPPGLLNEIGGQQFMNISNLTTMNTRAILQLDEKVNQLEEKVNALAGNLGNINDEGTLDIAQLKADIETNIKSDIEEIVNEAVKKAMTDPSVMEKLKEILK